MTSPLIDWAALAPLAILLCAAVLGVLIESFVPRSARRPVQICLAFLALAGSLLAIIWRWTVVSVQGPASVSMSPNGFGTFAEDLPALAFQGIIVVCSLFALLVIADRTATREGAFAASAATQPGSIDEREATTARFEQTEVFPLTLFAAGGMVAFTMAHDLLTLFISLEVLSLPLYVLCATARRRRALSQEAAMKYFLLGAFSSAFFLMGAALLYGFSGSISYSSIAAALLATSGMDLLLVAGLVLVLVGLLFKVGAAPFHSWTPDTYQGAPTPVTGFMAAGTKIAAFAAMLRFLYSIGRGAQWELTPALWTIAVLTMCVGTFIGLIQKDIKRLLAYSSIAHAGFILIGVAAFSQEGISSVAFYLAAYGIATVGAFGIVTLVRESKEGNILGEATSLAAWQGMGKTNPLLAVCMSIFLLSFAGIPLTSGFLGKFAVFSAGVRAGEIPFVVVAVLASAATAFFYFRLVVFMFFRDPEGVDTVTVESEGFSILSIVVCALLTLAVGIFPQPIFEVLNQATVFML